MATSVRLPEYLLYYKVERGTYFCAISQAAVDSVVAGEPELGVGLRVVSAPLLVEDEGLHLEWNAELVHTMALAC